MTTQPGLEVTYAVRRPRPQRLLAPLLTAGLVTATTVALRFRDPHVHGTWGLCPFKLLTGWDCPGCGGLRAVNDLTRGDPGAAASSNLLFFLAIPFVIGGWALWTRRAWQGTPRTPAARPRWVDSLALGALVVVLVAFTVARNTSAGAWLHS